MKNEHFSKIKELRHRLHKNPELSLAEAGTIRILQEFLRENTSLEIVDRDGWFYAVKHGNKQEAAIAFRADMDALPIEEGLGLPYASVHPGISHKCGHDGHMAALCGLALELDRAEVERTVFLIFQPAEEIGAGAESCVPLLREKKISEIYAFHNRSGFPENSIVLRRGLTQPASEGLILQMHGKTSHASAPEEGCNPSAAIAQMVLYSQQLMEEYRKNPQNGMAMLTIVGIKCGNRDFGISAGDGELCFTLRAEEESVMKEMEQNLIHHASELALRDGLSLEHSIRDYFPETRNHDSAVERIIREARKLNLPVIEMDAPWRSSEDFGHFLKECAGAMFYIGNGEDYPPVHTQKYDFNDNILRTAVDLLTALAMSNGPVICN